MSHALIRVIVGAAATGLGGLTYVFYFRSMTKGLTKPHAISWGLWAILDGIAFFAMLDAHAGPAIWLTGSTAALCGVTCLIGVWQRQVRIDRGDWATLAGAVVALVLMLTLSNPLAAMIAAQATTSIGYIPTARKVLREPESEDLPTYVTALIKYGMQVGALSTFSIVTLIQPVVSVIDSGYMSALIWWSQRRHRQASQAVPNDVLPEEV